MSKLIGYPLGFIMWLFYELFDNYAVSLVLFTVFIRLILIPLSIKQQKSTAAMQSLQPKLDKLKKQYGNNQAKMSEEQMKLYSEEGINPMSSCLPLFIQMPILYGVWDVVNRPVTHILRFSNSVLEWAQKITTDYYTANPIDGTNIASINRRIELYVLELVKEQPKLFAENPDFVEKVTSFKNTLFGFIDFGDVPTLKPEIWDASAVGLVVIAFASGFFQLLMSIYSMIRSKKTNTAATNNSAMASMNAMMLMMPVMSVWIALTCPAGLGFYWAISAIVGLVQTIVLNHIYTPEYVAKLVEKDKSKNKNKSGRRQTMMQKYQEMIENQNAQIEKNKGMTKIEMSEFSEDSDAADDIEDNTAAPDVKLSKSKQKEFERKLIAEARRRQAEKYGDEYVDED